MKEHRTYCKEDIMSGILEVRYTDLEKERQLSMDLLSWAESQGDVHGRAFAHTYLGDYYVAHNDYSQAAFHLAKGRAVVEKSGLEYPELMACNYNLQAICYDLQADDQNAAEYYIKTIALSVRIGDTVTECMALNNLGFVFQHHHSYEEANQYYKEAYKNCRGTDRAEFALLVLANLIEVLVDMGNLEEAAAYMTESDMIKAPPALMAAYHARNRCCVSSASGDRKDGLIWAEWALNHEDYFMANRMTAFEDFYMFCKSMLRIGDKEYADRFLHLMERTCSGGLNHLKMLEEKRMEYCLQFEPKETVAGEYRNYYRKTAEYKKLGNQAVVSAMKAKIDLDQVLRQKEDLETEREYLERQVYQDELTQLYNRKFVDQQLEKYAAASEAGISVIMLDVDYFKEYNDFYGHASGDSVLQTVAGCLRKQSYEGIFPCRYGGDEFICLCEGMGAVRVEEYIEGIREEMAAQSVPHEKSHCSNRVTLSIGYAAEETELWYDPYLLQQLADQAVYEAKIGGRDCYRRKRAKAI